MNPKKELSDYLEQKNIRFIELPVPGEDFPPAPDFWKKHNLIRCKNLFFRDNHGRNHFLVVIRYAKRPDIKKLQEITGRGSMTLASGWRLEKYLGLKPGFVSVFGLMNDRNSHVSVILDKELDQEKLLSFLPNTEGGSFFALSFRELESFLKARSVRYISERL